MKRLGLLFAVTGIGGTGAPSVARTIRTSPVSGRYRARLVAVCVAALASLALIGCTLATSRATRPPDGLIAFVVTRPEAGGVHVMASDGSDSRRLNSGAGPGVAWSPDGQKIVFTSNPGISVMNSDGSGVTRLTASGESPAWSPDGAQIAFVVRPEKSIDTMKEAEIEVMNADGSGLVRLTGGQVSDASPAWSPDGQRIAFERQPLDGPGGACEGSCVINVDGSGLAHLPVDGQDLAWSPDGQSMVLVAAPTGRQGIYLVRVDGSSQIDLTTSMSGLFVDPAWSPDGGRIAFAYQRGVTDVFGTTTLGNWEIDVMNADGSGLTRIAGDTGAIWGISWR